MFNPQRMVIQVIITDHIYHRFPDVLHCLELNDRNQISPDLQTVGRPREENVFLPYYFTGELSSYSCAPS